MAVGMFGSARRVLATACRAAAKEV